MNRAFLSLLTVAMLMSLGGCKETGAGKKSSAEVRYKVTIEVDTPEGMRSGSSVWSWTLSRPSLALASPYNGKFKGEAVAVDLPNGKTLFGLVSGQELIPERQFRELRSRPREREDRVADIRDIASNLGASTKLPCEKRTGDERGVERVNYRFDCIMLVSFDDINNPKSVFLVNYHDATASLGKGYAIKAITVTIADEPVTMGIKKRLGWLEEVGRERGTLVPDPPRLLKDSTPIQRVGPGYFTTELYK
ncbi:hypothetical protein [Sphingorhabdus sp. Alg231-15]|uniref:hypothetical protein n=1 Tax=Sphingorhabdus sp. Alg231-15 TaxID=1922222 RepID=UPI000D54CF04